MYVIKNSNGKYLSKIDREGIRFSSFVEDAISSCDRNDLVSLYHFLVGYLFWDSGFNIVKLSQDEVDHFLGLSCF